MSIPYTIYNTRSLTDANAPTLQTVAVTGVATFYSDMWTGEDGDGYGLHVEYTGTPTGTFSLWVSDKPNPNQANDNDWVQDTGFAPVNPAGAAGKFRDDTAVSKGYRKRLKYVNASGTGTVAAWVTVPRYR